MLSAIATTASELAAPVLAAARSAWVSTGHVARRLGLTAEAIRCACAQGRIPAAQLGTGGHWRISRAWLDEQMRRTAPVRRKA